MNSFNLILSTSRDFEKVAETEIWFDLLMLGDETPLIIHSAIPGLLLIQTKINAIEVISQFKSIAARDPSFFQYIIKLVPIDRVVETDVNLIDKIVKELIQEKSSLTTTGNFAIQIRKRATELESKDIIEVIAKGIENQVNLKHPDWIIELEIIGNICGISVIQPTDIVNLQTEQNIASTKIER